VPVAQIPRAHRLQGGVVPKSNRPNQGGISDDRQRSKPVFLNFVPDLWLHLGGS
jgi:hypothetical protein